MMTTLLLWLTTDWHQLLPIPWCNVCLACLAAFCGVMIGVERERKEKPTGTRTLALVCLGSAVFTMLSPADGRIAAQIISGVGFLGAGAIIHSRFGVLGLTSASTIWSVAAIGMAIGFGFAGGGVALCLLVLLVLTVISKFELRWAGACKLACVHVIYQPCGGKTLIQLEGVLDEFSGPGLAIKSHGEATREGCEHVSIHYCCVHKHHREVLTRIVEIPQVQELIRDDAQIRTIHVERAERRQRRGEITSG